MNIKLVAGLAVVVAALSAWLMVTGLRLDLTTEMLEERASVGNTQAAVDAEPGFAEGMTEQTTTATVDVVNGNVAASVTVVPE